MESAIRSGGEIDFVASPNLTAQPYDEWTLLGRTVKVETAAEIVAKKLWHRGDRATKRSTGPTDFSCSCPRFDEGHTQETGAGLHGQAVSEEGGLISA